jgi:hypothetical protein
MRTNKALKPWIVDAVGSAGSHRAAAKPERKVKHPRGLNTPDGVKRAQDRLAQRDRGSMLVFKEIDRGA